MLCQSIDQHETDIVLGVGILCSGIPKPCNKFHSLLLRRITNHKEIGKY